MMLSVVKTYEAIVKGETYRAGVPESFKVLVKELQSLDWMSKLLMSKKMEMEIHEDEEEG